MKKLLTMLALLVCLATAASCSIQVDLPDGSSAPSLSSSDTTTLGDPPYGTTSPTTSGIVTTEPPSIADPLPPLIAGEGDALDYIPDEAQPQLKKITEIASEGIVSSVSCYDRFMLINFYYSTETGYAEEELSDYAEWTEVSVVDLVTGEVTATQRYESVVTVGFLENGSVYFYQYEPLLITVRDFDGETVFRYTADESGLACIDPEGEGVAWISDWNGTVVERIPLNGGEPQTYRLSDAKSAYLQTVVEGEAYLSAFDDSGSSTLYRLTADGKCEQMTDFGGYYSVGDTLCREVGEDYRFVDLRQSIERVCYFSVDERDTYVLSADRGRFCLQWYNDGPAVDESRLILCMPSSGRRTELTLTEQYVYGQCWQDDALYLLIGESVGEREGLLIYVWDYSSAPYKSLDTGVHTVSDAEQDNLDYAEALTNEWGISIFFAEEDMGGTPSDYIADPLEDQQLISVKLAELATVLEAYPVGFFYELPYGNQDHLEIYLCEGLSPADSNGITTAIAISNTRGSALVVVLDVTAIDDLAQTLAHELLHMMERRIDQLDPSLLADWTSLTPGGDQAYYFSYHDQNGNEMNNSQNTWYGEVNPELVYFVDAYSKSYPTEDRARIFEYLVSSAGEPAFIESPVLRAKAERLCEIIRLTFPSVAAADDVAWEVD